MKTSYPIKTCFSVFPLKLWYIDENKMNALTLGLDWFKPDLVGGFRMTLHKIKAVYHLQNSFLKDNSTKPVVLV